MNIRNLTEEQREWIKEIQRYKTKRTERVTTGEIPSVICDTDTGIVYKTREGEWGGIIIEGPLGMLPIKSIPFRDLEVRVKQIERMVLIEGQIRLIFDYTFSESRRES